MIGQESSDLSTETPININSMFDVQQNPTQNRSQSLELDSFFVDQYLQENISSQEMVDGFGVLMGSNNSGLSQILNQFEINSQNVIQEDIKPEIPLTYPMVQNWSEISDIYNQMKTFKRPSITPDISPLKSAHDFKLILPEVTKHSKFCYSKTQQLFIKGDIQFHLGIQFKQIDETVKFIRLMPVIPTNISKPVRRCENHASMNFPSAEEKRYNVIHSDYPQVIYDGCKDGRSANERLSIVFPLRCSTDNGVGENIFVEETIPIMFVCQTSCIGRDDIEVICTLENSTEVLARTAMKVKICSCPKRDVQKRNEEMGVAPRTSRKRPLQMSSNIGKGKRIKIEEPAAQAEIQKHNVNSLVTFLNESLQPSDIELKLKLCQQIELVYIAASSLYPEREDLQMHKKFSTLYAQRLQKELEFRRDVT